MKTENLIEAILFHKAEPVSKKELSLLCDKTIEEINITLDSLEKSLLNRGIVLVRNSDKVTLKTSPEASELIQKITKEELSKDLGKAGLETLSIILYKSPISTSEIEYIRGVKSSFILRKLMIRGLIEKVENTSTRSNMYQPTFEALGYLGLSKISDLPEYEKTKSEIDDFMNEQES